MYIEKILNDFKALTLEMISRVKNDEEFDDLLEQRGILIEKLKELKPDKDEVKCVATSLGISKLEDELVVLINRAKADVKKQMANINKAKMAQKQYMNFQSGPHIFSTER